MQPVALLAELNELDLVVDGLLARQAQIAGALREPEPLKAARAALAVAEAELARWQVVQQEREAGQQKAQGKLAQTEQKLYSGKVHNPKELEDLQRDQQQLRRQKSQSEDDLLEALVAVESATEERSRRQAEVDRLSRDWAATQAKLRAEQARVAAQLPAAQGRQAAARRTVPPAYLKVYDSLRPRRGGRAVAEIEGDTCSACRVAVPPSKLAAARDGAELVYCDNCGRLLWDE